MITLNAESDRRKRSPYILDKLSTRATTTNGLYTLTLPTLELIRNNLFFLLKESTIKPFQQQYKMKPEYLSFDEYGTMIFGQLLMYVNGIYCPEEFDMDNITIPSLSAITILTNKKEPINTQTVDW